MNFKKSQWCFLIWAVAVSFLIAAILHYAYDFLGEPALLAGLMPVSESIWEHLKLVFYPICIIFLVPWCEQVKRISLKNRIIMSALATIIGEAIVAGGYYGLKNGFSIEGIVYDLILLIAGLTFGIYHGLILRRHIFPLWVLGVSSLYLIIKITLFYIFSFFPPNLPIFESPI